MAGESWLVPWRVRPSPQHRRLPDIIYALTGLVKAIALSNSQDGA